MRIWTGALALTLAAGLASAAGSAAPKTQACDRACLDGLVDQYLAGMIARSPQSLPWAATVHATENGVPIMIGDGLWATITARSKTPLRGADPATGQAVWIGVVEEHGQPGFLALRLKADGRRIAEAEMIVRRKGGPPQFGEPEHYAPDAAFDQTEAPQERRALIAAVDGYFSGLEGDAKAHPLFDADCARTDNGLSTTSGPAAEGGVAGCQAQLRARVFAPIRDVRGRRYPLVDEARGLVIAAGAFDLPATAPKPPAGTGLAWAADYPYSVGFLTAFKVRRGKIARIESVSSALPYLMPSPWSAAPARGR
jgi:hypothetical protein